MRRPDHKPMIVDACSGVVAVVVAAADETSHADARRAKQTQASQPREGLTNGLDYFCDASTPGRSWAGLAWPGLHSQLALALAIASLSVDQ